MRYDDWIERERRFRIKILRDWPEARDEGIYRVCQSCGEICLFSEDTCPNCMSTNITKEQLAVEELLGGQRIRCWSRFETIQG
jgi:uncharacterized OB-fold protein